MATLLDISLLGGAKVVFTFLLVYVIIWGLLVWVKPFGKATSTGPYAIIALVAAFFAVVSGTVRYLIEFSTPWFIILVIFLFFTLFIIRLFNVGESTLTKIIEEPSVYIVILVIIIVIILFSLASAFGQKSLEATQGKQQGVFYNPAGYPATDGTNGAGTTVGGTTTLEPGQDLTTTMTGSQPQPGEPGATATGNFSLNLINTLLHPKVMAIIAMILIATVTVWLLAKPEFV